MPTDHRAELKRIRDFRSLIPYLRDEMGWPIKQDSLIDVDDLFFDYTPEELGVDPGNAAKIKSIRQLRPLKTGQPFGVFFVQFEQKRLPVVALRRILSHVVVKRRASGNNVDRAAWRAGDLLFVSNYGAESARQITFAHFSEPESREDLPTLKVLGWDNRDTELHIDAVARELTEQLRWPDDEADTGRWRKQWGEAFRLEPREVVRTSKELSIKLARLARAIRERIQTALSIEGPKGPLTKLMRAFQETLINDLKAEDFADMYAQTIGYGLLSARIADPHKKTADDFAAHMRTNPFLRELMETFLKVGGRRGKAGGPGIDFDELGVSEVVDLLDDPNTHMEAVVRDFGDRNPQEDPVIHFYQDFLQQYDAKKRMQRGVFYTPRPVVSYIVRSVDELLRTEFGLEDGLADTTTWGEMAKRHTDLRIPEGVSPEQDFVQILDPATGTGTFLVEVIDFIHKTLFAKWKRQGHAGKKIDALWNEYVPKHLLPRLHGYELLMAPYAIAHLKIGLKLYETGYRFGSDERARIYLTNALEPAQDFSGRFEFAIPALANEAKAVNDIKRTRHFTAFIGNPPYAKLSSNRYATAEALVVPFKTAVRDERNIQPLSDDYVKFLGLAWATSSRVPRFVFGMITNRGYLTGLIHRGLRQVLTSDWRNLRIVDLHGDSNVGEQAPDGSANENVFDIQQGVAITLGVKGTKYVSTVERHDVWGTRDEKYSRLATLSVADAGWVTCAPEAPQFSFAVPGGLSSATERTISLTAAMPVTNTGLKTHRDELVIDFDAKNLLDRIHRFADRTRTDSSVRTEFFGGGAGGRYQPGDNRDWSMSDARKKLQAATRPFGEYLREIEYRPFDGRVVFYSSVLIDFPREDLMQHMNGGKNLGLIATRQVPNREFCHVLVTRRCIEMKTASHDRGTNLFPLWLRRDSTSLRVGPDRRPNFSESFRDALANAIKLPRDRCGIREEALDPEDLLRYIYAVLYSPAYRRRYADSLKVDFPRIPLPGGGPVFRELVRLGSELVALHLMESPKLDRLIGNYTGPKNPEVGRVSWSDGTVWIDSSATKKGQSAKPGTIGFRGVPEAVWNFHIGGYQVCEKWLKDRRGRALSKDDIAHYQKIVVALAETIRLMKEIDEVIERHGGWPGAFAPGIPSSDALGASDADAGAGASPSGGQQALLMDDGEPESSRPDRETGTSMSIDDLETGELIGAVRQLFSDGSLRDRETAIGDLAAQVGFTRIGSRIRESLDNAVRTAMRRGILENNGSGLRIQARSLEEYDRAFLKDQFLASLQGKAWTERDDAVQGFARWMGFRRTGSTIADTARSLINGLIREERLESDSSRIRRCR